MSRSTYAIAGFILVAAVFGIAYLAPTPAQDNTEIVYQVSTIDALLAGVYQESTPIAEVKKHGDLGLGTLDALDGEMIVVDGTVYQVKDDGSVIVVPDTTPNFFLNLPADGDFHIADLGSDRGDEMEQVER